MKIKSVSNIKVRFQSIKGLQILIMSINMMNSKNSLFPILKELNWQINKSNRSFQTMVNISQKCTLKDNFNLKYLSRFRVLLPDSRRLFHKDKELLKKKQYWDLHLPINLLQQYSKIKLSDSKHPLSFRLPLDHNNNHNLIRANYLWIQIMFLLIKMNPSSLK